MSEHTPGPWSAGIPGNPSVYGPDGMVEHSGLIARVFKGRKNVQLIAAAPELLAALKDAIEFANAANNQIAGQDLPASVEWLAIIAKAEGRS